VFDHQFKSLHQLQQSTSEAKFYPIETLQGLLDNKHHVTLQPAASRQPVKSQVRYRKRTAKTSSPWYNPQVWPLKKRLNLQ